MLNPELRIAIKELIEQIKNTSREYYNYEPQVILETERYLIKDKIFNLLKLVGYIGETKQRDLYSNTGEIEQIIKEVFEE